jgi:hypothetical protein
VAGKGARGVLKGALVVREENSWELIEF